MSQMALDLGHILWHGLNDGMVSWQVLVIKLMDL